MLVTEEHCTQVANMVETFPIRNETCARGLLSSLQTHLFQLEAEQRALEEQLEGGTGHAPGMSTVKLTRVMEQNMELKEEVAAVLQEKAQLQEQLDSLQNSGGDLPSPDRLGPAHDNSV